MTSRTGRVIIERSLRNVPVRDTVATPTPDGPPSDPITEESACPTTETNATTNA